jgi:dsRNA-specific ribonuclease
MSILSENEKFNQNDDVSKDGENLIFNPFNSNNKEITLNDVQSILKKYGINAKPHNLNLYKRAFVHKSYTKRPNLENEESNITIAEQPNNCLPLKTKSNERLEFLGDGVLECITKYYLYRRFPKADEGFMTEKKIALVKNEHIGKLAYDMRLHNWFIVSKHAEEKNTRTNLKKLGCLFEAFLGALFLDFNKIDIADEHDWFKNVFVTGPGFQMSQIFLEGIFETHVDWMKLINTDDNYKNKLQVRIQKEFKTTPDYLEINKDMETGFEMGVYLCVGQQIYNLDYKTAIHYNKFGSFEKIQAYIVENNKAFIFLGKGIHKIKKKAEQIACEEALEILE